VNTALKALRLPASDKWLLFTTTILLTAIVVGLHVVPFRLMSRLVANSRKSGPPRYLERRKSSSERVVWAVNLMSSYVPGATCLAKAFATIVLLERQGESGDLRFAVAKNKSGKLEAHAWVEQESKILIGQLADLSRFVVLSSSKEINL